MLADSKTISGKSLMGFGFGGQYSIEHLLLTSSSVFQSASVVG